jgi:hypothetical protein
MLAGVPLKTVVAARVVDFTNLPGCKNATAPSLMKDTHYEVLDGEPSPWLHKRKVRPPKIITSK